MEGTCHILSLQWIGKNETSVPGDKIPEQKPKL
jgi:hypothetical protein